METNVLLKFLAAVSLGYALVLGILAGSIPHSVAAVGFVLTWFVSRQINI